MRWSIPQRLIHASGWRMRGLCAGVHHWRNQLSGCAIAAIAHWLALTLGPRPWQDLIVISCRGKTAPSHLNQGLPQHPTPSCNTLDAERRPGWQQPVVLYAFPTWSTMQTSEPIATACHASKSGGQHKDLKPLLLYTLRSHVQADRLSLCRRC